VAHAPLAVSPTPGPPLLATPDKLVLMLLDTDKGLTADYVDADACRNTQELIAMGKTLMLETEDGPDVRIRSVLCERY